MPKRRNYAYKVGSPWNDKIKQQEAEPRKSKIIVKHLFPHCNHKRAFYIVYSNRDKKRT